MGKSGNSVKEGKKPTCITIVLFRIIFPAQAYVLNHVHLG